MINNQDTGKESIIKTFVDAVVLFQEKCGYKLAEFRITEDTWLKLQNEINATEQYLFKAKGKTGKDYYGRGDGEYVGVLDGVDILVY